MNLFYKIWKDPVWSKVISAGVIGLAVYLINTSDIFIPILNKLKLFMSKTLEVELWYIVFLNLSLLFFILLIIYLFVCLYKTQGGQSKNIEESYIEDYFFKIKWVWSYSINGDITNIVPLCPKCDYDLSPHNVDYDPFETELILDCDDCDFSLKPMEITYSELKNQIKKKVQKQIRLSQ